MAPPPLVACPPHDLIATARELAVDLQWQHPDDDGVVTFKVFRALAGGVGFTVVGVTTEKTFHDLDVPAKLVRYYVSATHGNPAQEFGPSNIVSTTPTDDPPPMPALLVVHFSATLYTLQFSLATVPADLAAIRILQAHNPQGPWDAIAVLPASARSYSGHPVKNKTYLKVVAVDRARHVTVSTESVEMNPGDFQRHMPPMGSNAPVTPVIQSGTGGETIVDLVFAPNTGVVHVYRSTTSGAGYVEIGTTTQQNYQDAGLAPGAYYYVATAVACDPPEESPFSNEVSATVTDNPPPPAHDLAVTLGTDSYAATCVQGDVPPDFAGHYWYRSWVAGGPYVRANAVPLALGSPLHGPIPRAPLYLRAASVDNAGHETMSAEEVVVQAGDIVRQEPKLNATYLGGAGSVTAWGGEFVWGVT